MIISYEARGDRNAIIVNKMAEILKPDIELHNGVVHAINHVLVPSDETLGSILLTMPRYQIFAKGFQLTGLNDSIAETYDMTYQSPYTSEFVDILGYTMKPLQQRRLGYTLFAEPDDVMRAAGIHSVEDLVAYAERFYGTDDRGQYTSRRNALNRFFSYHLLNRQMSTNAFVYSGPCTTSRFSASE